MASETTPLRRVYQFKKAFVAERRVFFQSQRWDLKFYLYCGTNCLWESKLHFLPQTRLWEGRNNNSTINFHTNIPQRSMFLQFYTRDILSKWRSWYLHNNKHTHSSTQPALNIHAQMWRWDCLACWGAADWAQGEINSVRNIRVIACLIFNCLLSLRVCLMNV